MNKTLLIISGGIEAVPGIKLAKKLGLNVVVSDSNPQAPGFEFADHKLLASTYNIEDTVSAATEFDKKICPIDGVICIASDVPLTVATVANKLNLPSITIETAKLAIDKFEMKKRFERDKIPIPWFSSVDSYDHFKELVDSNKSQLVIKPVDSRGSRGVLRIKENTNLEWVYKNAKKNSPTNRVMLEQFLEGPQVSTESLVVNKIAYTPCFSDRNYEFLDTYEPHIIENGGQLPSHLDKNIQKAVHDLIQKASISMGINNGVVKGDIVINNGKPYVIELAARLSGGYFCTHEIPLNTGVDLVGAAIRQSLGEKIDTNELMPKFNRPVAQRYLFPKPGKVNSINLPKWALSDPDISLLEVRINKGDTIEPVTNHPARAGVVITTGNEVSNAINKAESVISSIEIVMEPN